MVCAFCGGQITSVRYRTHKRKAYHFECFDRLSNGESQTDHSAKASVPDQDRQALESYIKQLFNLEELTYLLHEQLNRYIQVQNKSPATLLKILRYFYEIKGNKPNKDKPSIGIVDYVEDEARAFYLSLHELTIQAQGIKPTAEHKTIQIRSPNQNLQIKTDISKL